MSYASNYILQRQCWRKKGAYLTRKEAHRHARAILKRAGVQMYTYGCTGCGRFHLTKDPMGKGKII